MYSTFSPLYGIPLHDYATIFNNVINGCWSYFNFLFTVRNESAMKLHIAFLTCVKFLCGIHLRMECLRISTLFKDAEYCQVAVPSDCPVYIYYSSAKISKCSIPFLTLGIGRPDSDQSDGYGIKLYCGFNFYFCHLDFLFFACLLLFFFPLIDLVFLYILWTIFFCW